MPKGEYDTPGRFWLDVKNNICERRDKCSVIVLTPLHLDEAECEELVGLLNKGTHFDAMLEALKHVRANCLAHPDQLVDEAIAEAESRDDGG